MGEVLVLTDKHQENQEIKHRGLPLQREGCVTYYLPRRLEADVVNSLVTSELSVAAISWILTQPFIISTPISRAYFYERCHI